MTHLDALTLDDVVIAMCRQQVRAINAEAEVERLTVELATVNDTLRRRSAALNRTGTQNDHLRATVAACPSCSTRLEPTT